MKFLCKEFWTAAFGRQVDNLRTNHQVMLLPLCIYNCFRIFRKMGFPVRIWSCIKIEMFRLVSACLFTTFFQGVYVIQDNKFFILANFAEGKQYVEVSAIYLAFPCGVIRSFSFQFLRKLLFQMFYFKSLFCFVCRGALYNLGITSLVTSSMEILPAVKFHVHMQQKS